MLRGSQGEGSSGVTGQREESVQEIVGSCGAVPHHRGKVQKYLFKNFGRKGLFPGASVAFQLARREA